MIKRKLYYITEEGTEERKMAENITFEELQEVVSVCLDEITNLKEENKILQDKVVSLVSALNDMAVLHNQLVANAENTNVNIELIRKSIDNLPIENMKYEINDSNMDRSLLYFPQLYKIEETIESIVNDRKSMARFGDGEFAIMCNKKRQAFQHLDDRLAGRLKEVIQSEEEGFLIGIADNYGSLDAYSAAGKWGIRNYMTDEVRKDHRKFLNLDRRYHNAYISRPYVLYADNLTDAPQKRFRNLKRIWENRKIIFVEGTLTRLGVGNDLFQNAKQIRRIEAPPVNSFDKYDEILEAALKFAEPDSLFLIALGPAAGVLAYDLYHAGYQAIDIGHIDLEYEWYLKGTGERCEVKNKYNNEWYGGEKVEDIYDEEYSNQIIYVVE